VWNDASFFPRFKGRVESRIDEGEGCVTDEKRKDFCTFGDLRLCTMLRGSRGSSTAS
jgi:hypothetical protein